jgi:hypothetical protein
MSKQQILGMPGTQLSLAQPAGPVVLAGSKTKVMSRRANCLLLIRRLLCPCCVLLACCKQAGCHRPACRLRQAE